MGRFDGAELKNKANEREDRTTEAIQISAQREQEVWTVTRPNGLLHF